MFSTNKVISFQKRGSCILPLIMKQIKSEEQFHLWLEEGPEQGAVMKVEETSTLYKLPKHPSAQLQELLKE